MDLKGKDGDAFRAGTGRELNEQEGCCQYRQKKDVADKGGIKTLQLMNSLAMVLFEPLFKDLGDDLGVGFTPALFHDLAHEKAHEFGLSAQIGFDFIGVGL